MKKRKSPEAAALSQDMRELIELFNEKGIQYLVIGGHAVNAYTEPRATKDLDILVNPSKSNALEVFKALAEFGAPLQGMDPTDFEDKESFFIIGIKPNRVDILKSIPGLTFEKAWKNRCEVHVDDLVIPIPSAEDLLSAKLAAGRPYDIGDAAKLKSVIDRRGKSSRTKK